MSEAAAPTLYRRDGEFLVVRTGAVLPARCVRTNQSLEAGDWVKSKPIAWVPVWVQSFGPVLIFVLALPWWLGCQTSYFLGAPFLLASFCLIATQKRGRVTYGLSSQVSKSRRKKLIGAAIGAIAGTTLFVLEWNDVLRVPLLLIPALWLVSFLVAAPVLSPFRVFRYQDGEFWLKGASSEFLDSLASSSPDH